jgi:hypothetical protein
MVYLAWVVSLVYLIALTISLPFGVFALAVSPAKGQTIKRMLLVFISVAPAVLVIGFVAAEVFQSHPIARLTGLFCFLLGMLAGAIAGWMHARSMRKQQPAFPTLSIRG